MYFAEQEIIFVDRTSGRSFDPRRRHKIGVCLKAPILLNPIVLDY